MASPLSRPPLRTTRARLRAALALTLAAAVGACAYPYTPRALPPADAPAPPAQAAAELRQPVTILVSIDGFRPDYLRRGVTPHLDALAREGVSAPMQPSFPTKTFPNHWTLVTGLHPDRHGIVANLFEDARRPGETFTMASDDPFWWNDAEPIWVTAEKAGIRSATMFWPGSSVAWGGTRATAWPHDTTGGTYPHDWQQHSDAITGDQRVRAIMDWLNRPAGKRPRLLTLYFSTVDTAGHRWGPDDARTTREIAAVDAEIGKLRAGLAWLRQPADIVIVSDHGMAATSSERVVALDRVVAPADARIVESGPYASFVPTPGREAAVAAALLRPHPHMTCWRREAIPAHLAYGRNPRVPPFLCLGEPGWLLNKSAPTAAFTGGNHGYDNRAPEMQAIFIAAGPSFRAGGRLASVASVDVAPLLRRIVGLPAATGLDGSDAPFKDALTR